MKKDSKKKEKKKKAKLRDLKTRKNVKGGVKGYYITPVGPPTP